MEMIKKEELLLMNGGSISLTAGLLIVAGITFLIGVIDGFLRPYACRK